MITEYVEFYNGLDSTTKAVRQVLRDLLITDNPEDLAKQLSKIERYAGSLTELTAKAERKYREMQEKILLDISKEGLRAAEQDIIINSRCAPYREKRDYCEGLLKVVSQRIISIQSLLAYKRDELRRLN